MDRKQNSIPNIRFKYFIDNWQLYILGNINDVRDGTHDSPTYHKDGFPLVTSKNLTDSGLSMSNVSYISKDDFDKINKRSKVNIGDILFGMIGTIGNPVLIDNSQFAIKNVALIKEKGDVLNIFLIQLFKSEIFKKYINNQHEGNTQKFLSLSNIRKFELYAPSRSEQTKIGNFFQKLDKLIELSQTRLEQAKIYKQSMLQKMFPQKGESVPQIRFKGGSGDWGSKKIKDISDITIGEFVIKTKQNPKNLYPVYNGGITCTGFYDQFNNTENKIVISARGANAGFVNFIKCKYWAGNSCYSLGVKNKDLFLIEFLFYFLKKNQNLLTGNQQTANIPSVSKYYIENFKILLPALKEQIKIGSFFQKLDQRIEHQTRKLEHYQQLKKALLQRMFV